MNGDGRPIRVLHTISGLHVAGVGQVLLQNIAALEKVGVHSSVAYLRPNHHLLERYKSAGFEPTFLDYSGLRSMPSTVRKMRRLVKDEQIDIIHTNHQMDRDAGILTGWVTGKPVVTTCHDTTLQEKATQNMGRAKLTLRSWLYRRRLAGAIAVSQAVADSSAPKYNLGDREMTVIYSGVEAETYRSGMTAEELAYLKAELGVSNKAPILLNVARLHPMKGQKYLVEMMKTVSEFAPGAHLLITGEGELRAELQSAVDEAGLADRITLLGRRDDVPKLLNIADIFLFPSHESEGLGMAVIEAMAAGVPVVATKLGPLVEVVQDGETGFLVPPGDPGALADAVRSLLDPERASRFGEAGRKVVQAKFDSHQTAIRMREFYERQIAGEAPASRNGG